MFNVIFLVVVFVAASALMRGWVLTVLWDWFLVPLGVHPISIVTALGITLIVGMFTSHLATERTITPDSDLGDMIITTVLRAFLAPLSTLAFGAIILAFA